MTSTKGSPTELPEGLAEEALLVAARIRERHQFTTEGLDASSRDLLAMKAKLEPAQFAAWVMDEVLEFRSLVTEICANLRPAAKG